MRLLVAILRIVPFAFVVSCHATLDAGPNSVVGNYALVSVDGAPLPFHTTTGLTLRGAVNLKNDGHYALTQTDSATTGGVTATSSTGHWSLQDNAFTFLDDIANGLRLGVLAADTVKLDNNAHHNAYVRQ